MRANKWLNARRPLLIGHRGANLTLPENTLAAFAQAVEEGADGIELDVQLSADGEVAIIHDADLQRLTGNPLKVSQLSADELRRQALGHGQGVPMLPDLFELLGKTTLYNVELKSFGLNDHGLAEKVAGAVRAFGLQAFTLISSFNPLLVRRAQQIFEPETAVALLRAPGPAQYSKLLVRTTVDNPHFSLINEESIAAAVRQGRRTFAWTVDDPQTAQRLVDLGVDGIITNDPGGLRQALQMPE
jgi:glycerophosphoryl diester phosphodiesterase